jgi:hypothetical protein
MLLRIVIKSKKFMNSKLLKKTRKSLKSCFKKTQKKTKKTRRTLLKEVAFIAGKSENQADKFFFIRFSIDNSIANISFYTLSCPKLKFRYYLTFEIMFLALKSENSAFDANFKV